MIDSQPTRAHDEIPAQQPLESRWLWPFELLEQIGQGGMGVVYRARFVKNDKHFAVKLLPVELAANSKQLERFRRETKLLKALNHPHIVRCFGGQCENSRPFYAMELVEGGTLADRLRKRGRFTWQETVDYAMQMCAALAFAHSRGIVHRDVKPANFLMTRAGMLKLSDFGLAWVQSDARLTTDGKTVGSFHYMAPEQIQGKPAVPQSDLYALGCVLFEMLTGHPPFFGGETASLLYRHLRDKPPAISDSIDDCPADLENLVLRLLAKSPDERPADAHQVAQRLATLSPITADKPLRSESRRVGKAGWQAALAPTLASPLIPDSAPDRQQIGRSPHLAVTVMLAVACWLLLLWIAGVREQAHTGDRAVQLWIDTFRHNPNVTLRTEAAQALGTLGSHAETLPALAEGLADENPLIREAAARGLKEMGPAAAPVAGKLKKTQKTDEREAVRQAAGDALTAIQTGSRFSFGWLWWTLGLILILALAIAWDQRDWFRQLANSAARSSNRQATA